MLDFAIQKSNVKKDLFFWIALLGIVQAVLVNILSVKLPLLSLVTVAYLCYKIKDGTASYNTAFLALFSLLILLLIWGVLLDGSQTKQITYHINVILCLFFAKTIVKDSDVELEKFAKLLWWYVILSLIIYFKFWDFFANKISQEDNLINLRSSGIKRSFGLLFSPLANGYFLLLSFYLLMAKAEKKYTWLKLAIIVSIVLCLTRGAFVSLALFGCLYLFYRRKWMIIISICLLAVAAYFLIEPFQIIIDSIIKLEDSQGSAQGHVESLSLAISFLKTNPLGSGFIDVSVESWVFMYGIIYGYLGIIILLLPWIYLVFRLILKRLFLEAIIFTSILPCVFIIPFHTFNLTIAQFFLMVYLFYYTSPKKITA